MGHTIIQLSAGSGPRECRRFIPLLADLIRRDAGENGLGLVTLSPPPVPGEDPASIRFAATEPVPETFRTRWEGTIQWIWQSTIRPHHPRKNWFVKVSFSEFPETDGTCRPEDLRFETFRASGAGGQHVNRTDSAVRVTHLPTGLTGQASEERSQIRNREIALLRLREKLLDGRNRTQAAETRSLRMEHYRLERGGPVRVFIGRPPKEKKNR